MSWIESDDKLLTDPKLLDLKDLMEWELNFTIGAIHRFRWWCVDHCRTGDLRGLNDNQIGRAVGLDSNETAKRFVESMKRVGFIETDPYFRVANWWEIAGRFLQSAYSHYPDKWQEIAKQYASNMLARDTDIHTDIQKERKKDNIPLSAVSGVASPAKKPKKPPPAGYETIVEHICMTFTLAKGGVKYPFGGFDGKIIIRLLGLYAPEQILALWDLFLGQNWDWKNRDTGKMVRVAHDLRQFQAKVTVLLDDNRYKAIAEKYAVAMYGKPITIPVKLKTIPPPAPDTTQDKKVEAYKQLQSVAKE